MQNQQSMSDVLIEPIIRHRLVRIVESGAFKTAILIYYAFVFLMAVVVIYLNRCTPGTALEFYMSIIAVAFLYKIIVLAQNESERAYPGCIYFILLLEDLEVTNASLNLYLIELILVIAVSILACLNEINPIKADKFTNGQAFVIIISNAIIVVDGLLFLSVLTISHMANLALREEPFKMQNEQEECAICKEDLSEGQMVKTLKCRHIFHSPCVNEWLNIRKCCPLCQQNIIAGSSIREIIAIPSK
jgi:Ring finger domain